MIPFVNLVVIGEDLILGVCKLLFLAGFDGVSFVGIESHLLIDDILLHLASSFIGKFSSLSLLSVIPGDGSLSPIEKLLPGEISRLKTWPLDASLLLDEEELKALIQ